MSSARVETLAQPATGLGPGSIAWPGEDVAGVDSVSWFHRGAVGLPGVPAFLRWFRSGSVGRVDGSGWVVRCCRRVAAAMPAARPIGLNAIAAQTSQALLAQKCPDGRCARGPFFRSAMTGSTIAWARCAFSAPAPRRTAGPSHRGTTGPCPRSSPRRRPSPPPAPPPSPPRTCHPGRQADGRAGGRCSHGASRSWRNRRRFTTAKAATNRPSAIQITVMFPMIGTGLLVHSGWVPVVNR